MIIRLSKSHHLRMQKLSEKIEMHHSCSIDQDMLTPLSLCLVIAYRSDNESKGNKI